MTERPTAERLAEIDGVIATARALFGDDLKGAPPGALAARDLRAEVECLRNELARVKETQ